MVDFVREGVLGLEEHCQNFDGIDFDGLAYVF